MEFFPVLPCTFTGETPESDQPRFTRLQRQTEFLQPFAQNPFKAARIFAVLEPQNEIIHVADVINLAFQPQFNHFLHPQIDRIVQIDITDQYTDRAALRRSFCRFKPLLILHDPKF